MPSTASVELPKGETDIYYAEAIQAEDGIALATPEDLEYSITDAAGVSVRVDSRGGEPEQTEDGMTRVIGAVFAPADGLYAVKVTSAMAVQRISPEITFGQSPFQAVSERFENVIDTLKGPSGVALLALLIVLFLLPHFRRALATESPR